MCRCAAAPPQKPTAAPTRPDPQIKAAYAKKKGLATNSIRFQLDGDMVNDSDTPKSLEMEDDEQIDAQLEQVGGTYMMVG